MNGERKSVERFCFVHLCTKTKSVINQSHKKSVFVALVDWLCLKLVLHSRPIKPVSRGRVVVGWARKSARLGVLAFRGTAPI